MIRAQEQDVAERTRGVGAIPCRKVGNAEIEREGHVTREFGEELLVHLARCDIIPLAKEDLREDRARVRSLRLENQEVVARRRELARRVNARRDIDGTLPLPDVLFRVGRRPRGGYALRRRIHRRRIVREREARST